MSRNLGLCFSVPSLDISISYKLLDLDMWNQPFISNSHWSHWLNFVTDITNNIFGTVSSIFFISGLRCAAKLWTVQCYSFDLTMCQNRQFPQQPSQVSQQPLLNSGGNALMTSATPGLGQNPEGLVTSTPSSVSSNMGLTFSGVGTGSHNMPVLTVDQQDNAAVSTNTSCKLHWNFPCLIIAMQCFKI